MSISGVETEAKKGSIDAFILMSLPRQQLQRENEACKIIRNHPKAVSIAHRLFKMCQKVRSVSFTA